MNIYISFWATGVWLCNILGPVSIRRVLLNKKTKLKSIFYSFAQFGGGGVWYIYLKTCVLLFENRDDNFAPPLPASPRASFPRPVKVVGREWGKILALHHGVGWGWV